ncbi:MAG: aminotransferase class III-fold pyridoxal phosphate-dependent enzyme, partial [Pseudomonadota bacterium]|nr:aminotransferase class III-fold pyridoxal phosphate-dependent enzyme [Pseudomonadota bacterium]
MRDKNFLIENNARHFWHPMAHPADMQKSPPTIITKADGVHVEDVDGRRVLDGVGGLWCVNLGHSCEPVKQAIRDQLDIMPFFNSFRGTTNAPAIELSYALREFFAPEE